MDRVIVLYSSKYGATRKYARWLAEELECRVVETKKASLEQVREHDTIILGGGVYASGIAGIRFLKRNYPHLREKKIIVFAVGASPHEENAISALRERNLKGPLSGLPLCYCRGALDEGAMTWLDRTLCKMLKKMAAKKDPAIYEPWERALVEAGPSNDWTEREQIQPILDHLRA